MWRPFLIFALMWSTLEPANAELTRQRPATANASAGIGSTGIKPVETQAEPNRVTLPTQADFASVAQAYKIIPHSYPIEGAFVGEGWDSFFDRKTNGFCVTGNVSTDQSIASTKLDFERIDDKEHIFRSLQVDASASFNGGLFSASGKAEYSNSLKVDSSSLNILASVRVDRSIQTLIPSSIQQNVISAGSLRLSDEALLLRKTDRRAFESRCGDSFVASVRFGGEFDAYLQFSVVEGETKSALFSSVKAGGFGGSGSASFKQLIESKQSKQAFDYKLFQTGHSSGSNPTSADEIIQKFTSYGTEKDNFNPSPYEMYLISYSQLETGGLPSDDMPTNKYMSRIATHYFRLMNMYMEFEDVIARPENYYISMFFRDPAEVYLVSSDILTASQLQDRALTDCLIHRICDEQRVTQEMVETLSHTQVTPQLVSAVVASGVTPEIDFKRLLDVAGVKIPSPATPSSEEYINATSIDAVPPGDQYYLWLASRPFKVSEINPKSFLFADGKTVYKAGVNVADLGSTQEFATREARQWILVNRLMPISESFCQESSRHWMCAPPSHLRSIVDKVKIVIAPEYLKPDNPPPVVPPPTPARVPDPPPLPPRDSFRDCSGHRGQFC